MPLNQRMYGRHRLHFQACHLCLLLLCLNNLVYIPLASFEDSPKLKTEGNNLYRSTLGSGLPSYGLPVDGTFGEIVPGFLETSNVKITDELVDMIRFQQAFTGNSRLLQTEIDITNKLINR